MYENPAPRISSGLEGLAYTFPLCEDIVYFERAMPLFFQVNRIRDGALFRLAKGRIPVTDQLVIPAKVPLSYPALDGAAQNRANGILLNILGHYA